MKKLVLSLGLGLGLVSGLFASHAFAATGIVEFFSNQPSVSGQISFTGNDVYTQQESSFGGYPFSTALTTSQGMHANGLYVAHINTGFHFDQDPATGFNSTITNLQLALTNGSSYAFPDTNSWSGQKDILLYIDIFYNSNGNAFADCKNQEINSNGNAQCSVSLDGSYAYATFLASQ